MRERSKLPMLLTELTLMLLIFSVCAAICISVFAVSRKTANESGELGHAAVWAQSAAEAYRAAKGDVSAAAESIGADETENGFVFYFDGEWEQSSAESAEYTLVLTKKDETAAHIEVTNRDKTLFSLDVKAVAYGE